MTAAEVIAVAGDDDRQTIGHYLLFGLPIVVITVGGALVLGLFGVRYAFRRARQEAQLMTHSSAFWARWPPDRLPRAPYAELAAEAARCEQLIVCAKASLTLSRKRPSWFFTGDFFDRRLAEYEGMLTAVQQAMARYPRQGWPTA